MRLSVRAKIVLITVAILLFAIGTNILAGSAALAREYSNALQLEAFVVGQSLKLELDRLLDPGTALEDLVGFDKQCQEMVDTYEDIAYAMVVDVDGKILFHNDPSQRGGIISDAATLKAVKSAEDAILIHSKQGEKYYDAITPAWDSHGRQIGAVRIGFPARLVTEKVGGLVGHYIGVTLISLGLAIILLVSALSVWVTKPLMKLVTVIQEIGREGTDSAKWVDINSKDEMGQLAFVFNQMIRDLNGSHKKIRKHTQELELKVEERTAELKATNEQLQDDIAERTRAEKELQKATDELEKQNTRLATLYRVGQMVNSTLKAEAILDRLTDEAMRVTHATHGQVLLVQTEAGRFERCSQRGFSPEEAERARTVPLPLDQGINGRAYATHQPVCVDDVQAEPGYFPLIPTTRAELALPIIRDGQVLGNLDLQSPEAGDFRDVDLDYLNALANQVAIALQNAHLFEETQAALTEARLLAEALRVSEERFALAVQGSNDGIWDWDIVNDTLYWSPRLKGQLEYADDELDIDFETFQSLVHPNDRERITAALEAHLKDRVPYEVEDRLRTKSGEYRWFYERGQAVWDEDGRPLRMAGSSTDITERVRAVEALQESEKRYRSLFEDSPISLWEEDFSEVKAYLDSLQASGVKDLGTYFEDHPEAVTHCATLVKVVDVNKATLKMYKAEDKNEFLRNLGVVVGKEARQVFTEELIALAEGQSRFESEATNSTPMGDGKHIVLTCQVAPGYEETLSKVLISIQDVTELKKVEEQLQHYAARLEQSNRELEEFAYIASHDLQEPLRKIQAFGDRLKTKHGQTLGDQGRDYLERMQNAAARMQALINGLLTYSRVTTKAHPFVPVDLAQVAQEVMSDLEVRIQEVGGRVDVENLPRIEADPTQMRQLLQNLVANALKFHRQDQPPVVKVYAGNAHHNGVCQIFVEDNGIGFDEKYLNRIFHVFQRLHGRSEYEGSGVGLATCRKIVVRHGGRITARSTPGQGATFIVTLPVRQSQGEVNQQ